MADPVNLRGFDLLRMAASYIVGDEPQYTFVLVLSAILRPDIAFNLKALGEYAKTDLDHNLSIFSEILLVIRHMQSCAPSCTPVVTCMTLLLYDLSKEYGFIAVIGYESIEIAHS